MNRQSPIKPSDKPKPPNKELEEMRHRTRASVTFSLIGLTLFVTAGAILGANPTDNVVTPLFTLVGAAIGYWFRGAT